MTLFENAAVFAIKAHEGMQRKAVSLEELGNCKDRNVKILWLSDKLSNMRSFYHE